MLTLGNDAWHVVMDLTNVHPALTHKPCVRASRSDSNEYSVNQSIDGSIDPVGSQGAGQLANRTFVIESLYVQGTYTRDREEHLC
jgi:hypothetical protein